SLLHIIIKLKRCKDIKLCRCLKINRILFFIAKMIKIHFVSYIKECLMNQKVHFKTLSFILSY
ncbi:TPA: hypothetical protein JD059_17205, partial [Clostridioides difficile]|nr:hypothetical protein [Clostridioides difficile]